jgi:acetyl/propionyl-CoA carboxylase alpha subunit
MEKSKNPVILSNIQYVTDNDTMFYLHEMNIRANVEHKI